MKNVAILTHQNCALFELSCAVELFALPRPEFSDWYDCDVVSFDASPLRATGGVTIAVTQIRSLRPYDMLVIPSWSIDLTVPNNTLARQLRAFDDDGKIILTFCSGAFLAAQLGILDHREATTHWRYAEQFKQRFPAVKYIDNVLYVLDNNIGCSAGSAAAIDLGLAFIRQHHGTQVANQVARRLVMSPHRKGGQSQFVETPVTNKSDAFSDALDWALAHLNQPLQIDTLADKSHMSRRNFDRLFRRSYGCSPKQWLITQRLSLARSLLEQDTGSIELIAHQSGFDNANSMRHHFRKALGVSPRQYRDQFATLTNHSK